MFHTNFKKHEKNVVKDKTLLAEIIHPIHHDKDPNIPYSLAFAQLKPEDKSRPHTLTESTETYIIIRGKGEITVDDKKEPIHSGSVIVVPPNSVQYLKNIGNELLEFFCIVSPPWQKNKDRIL